MLFKLTSKTGTLTSFQFVKSYSNRLLLILRNTWNSPSIALSMHCWWGTKWYSHFGRLFIIKLNMLLTYSPAIWLLGIYPRREKLVSAQKLVHGYSWVLSCVHLLCDPMDYSPWGSSVHGILLAGILGCHFPLQRTFQTQGSILHLQNRQANSLPHK